MTNFASTVVENLVVRDQSRIAKPFVKWVGGKRSLLHEILSRMPANIDTYYEPFVGGGAVYFASAPNLKKAVLTDSNSELIGAYTTIQSQPSKLIAKLKTHAKAHNKEHYYRVRERSENNSIAATARFLYLNKTCFNGLYRVNRGGKFNAPMGDYKNPNIVQEENIFACHYALKNAKCRVGDFSDINPKAGDFVYFDPPYHPLTSTAKFTQYQQNGFIEEDQMRLRDFIVSLHRKGVKIMLSNSNTPLIKDLYKFKYFRKYIVHAPRFVNCKPDQRGKITELLIINYGAQQ